MSRRQAWLITALATGDAWRLLVLRIDDSAEALLLMAFAGFCAWRVLRSDGGSVGGGRVAAMLVAYAAIALFGPALAQIGAATASLVLIGCHGRAMPATPLLGTAFLVLPVMPTLDFMLAYPLRVVSAAITVSLLRINGLDVALRGVALDWHGRLLLFDGPCSGVRMLWAALLLASFAALLRGLGWREYARLLVGAVALAILANALRAASLFYLENGFVPALAGGWAHEAVGLLALLLLVPIVLRLSMLGRRCT